VYIIFLQPTSYFTGILFANGHIPTRKEQSGRYFTLKNAAELKNLGTSAYNIKCKSENQAKERDRKVGED
jgi:hypothetical protein